MLERYGHGGDLWTAEELYGIPREKMIDYSSNMNPLGPPDAVKTIMTEKWRELIHYPDPAVRELTARLAAKHGVEPSCVLVGNGAAELIDLAVRMLRPRVTGLVSPSFGEYEETVERAEGRSIGIATDEPSGFVPALEALREAAGSCDALILGHPNNPTGRVLPEEVLRWLAAGADGSRVVVDEAFLDFTEREEQLTLAREAAASAHLIVIRSMTKFYAVPGIRLGYAIAHPDVIARMRRLQVHWSVNALAQWIGLAALADSGYSQRTLAWLPPARDRMTSGLRELGLQVYESDVNFILFTVKPLGLKITDVQRELGRRGVLLRDASTFKGLDDTYGRLAVKEEADNMRVLRMLKEALETLTHARGEVQTLGQAQTQVRTQAQVQEQVQEQIRTQEQEQGQIQTQMQVRGQVVPAEPVPASLMPAVGTRSERPTAPASLAKTIMLQGTASDVGKSLLTAALCRILLQDGCRVAPFKSQNMSLNSYVTPDGKEIGRAQGMQADACRIAATTDMNPILLKPKKDMVSQVVVHGKPYRDLDARTYREKYLPEAETVVKEALGRLRQSVDVVVMEGAGSPAEVNLKSRDIVNMRLAGWADAPVLLVADIDRGGVFASLVGTLDILTEEERARVKGFVINKFRGDVTLLKPGLDWLEARTGKPVLGVVPYLPDLGLEDEDSASLDRRLAEEQTKSLAAEGRSSEADGPKLDIAVIRHPRLSNFTDIDPLLQEPDVRIRFVTKAAEFGHPDAVILPGSKNTVDDLLQLREAGLDREIVRLAAAGGWVVGICAGYQMLGRRLLDPELVESGLAELSGLGLLPAETVFAADKRTVRAEGRTSLYAAPGSHYPITGYEIHMGRTSFLEPVEHPFILKPEPGELEGESGTGEGKPEGDYPQDRKGQLAHDGIVTGDGRIWGTYLHGIMHNDDFRRAFLNRIRAGKGLAPLEPELRFLERREAAFDRLAEHVRGSLDMTRLYEMINNQ
ncbi:L-threonine O-3-phosphate decarboxylase /adenosylcobyric acid synthase (glutamine-hydrolysing) [Paenibacillus sp. UNCCL117]|uniref:cobyric acid synthase n=1 Tax=unclassified Paenibacillus TaxID=185978 RepID=UPI000884B79C|nr:MULTISPECIES: cobyric acid synthase [unclassified Paenibacillus]SDC00844.1 cobyric acid synthase CobQ/L-threonine-O-3-phosphate decarboxylase,TIGR01140 [Paenibacillus sp. cl123]SFW36453.1 L-threonine O-3-phosphate decarboxylase /adenosylcobyric acid synthase (glutamine-hydrolysing) [Paenibacillus sp. UNCCL117]